MAGPDFWQARESDHGTNQKCFAGRRQVAELRGTQQGGRQSVLLRGCAFGAAAGVVRGELRAGVGAHRCRKRAARGLSALRAVKQRCCD